MGGNKECRSTYHLEMDRRQHAQGSSSRSPYSSSVWKFIWQLKVPRAVQLFLWRGWKLFKRKIVDDPLCPLCGKEPETSEHFLWRCEASSVIWAECNRRLQKSTIKEGDFLSIFEPLTSRLEPQAMELVAVVAQKMWLRRNRLVFGGTIQPPTCLVESAKEMLRDFHLAQAPPHLANRPADNQHQQWRKPPPGWVKMNWDIAAIDREKNFMGTGIIVRDHSGQVLTAMCSNQPYMIHHWSSNGRSFCSKARGGNRGIV